MHEEPGSPPLHDPERLRGVGHALAAGAAAQTAFDRLASLAAHTLHAPVAQVNLISADQQISVSSVGPGEWAGPRRVPLAFSYCRHSVGSGEALLVGDAREHPLVRENPATTESGIVAYASVPLTVAPGVVVGTLCVVDFVPREWSEEEVATLESLADIAVAEIRRPAHAEAELLHLSALLDSVDDAVVGVDLDGVVRSWSAGAARLFGFAPGEILGRSVARLIPPESRDQLDALLQRVARGEVIAPGDVECVRRDGARLHVSRVVTPVHDLAGRVVGATGLLRDVTARVEAEEKLRESERRLSTLLHNLPGMAYRCRNDQSWTMELVSEGALELTGYPPSALEDGRVSFGSLIHPEDQEHVWREVQAAVRGRRRFQVEYRIRTGRDEERRVCEQGQPVFSAGGELLAIEGFITDVTEQRTAEAALQRSEARFRTMIEHSAEVISILAVDGTVRYQSPSIERVLGYAPAEMGERNAFEFIHPEDLPSVQAAFTRAVEEASPVSVEFRFRHRDGSYRVLSATGMSVLGDPDVRGVVVNSHDITELRQSEERLRQGQKMEAVGRLAGGIAHDFNNVLTVISGNATLALMDLPHDSPVREDVEQIVDAADRAAKLTRQLLAFSRQQVIQPRVVNLNDVVSDMERMLRRTLGEDIEFVTALDPRLGHVEADPGLLEQILMNLAVNARDAMPTGGKLVTETRNVELSGEDAGPFGRPADAGAYVAVVVTDTGVGMSKEVRERMFEPFFTTKPAGKGTGLGLATVYGIVKQSGGWISVDSEEGRGTTFTIYLPRVDAHAESADVEGSSEPDRRRPTVLLVEDEALVRSVGRRMLERLHFTVLEAENGEAALRIADEHDGRIDLLLTDVVMPEMGGRELADRVAARWPHIPVLYTSGYTDELLLRHGVRDGSVALLQKPYSQAALAEMVAQTMGRSGADA